VPSNQALRLRTIITQSSTLCGDFWYDETKTTKSPLSEHTLCAVASSAALCILHYGHNERERARRSGMPQASLSLSHKGKILLVNPKVLNIMSCICLIEGPELEHPKQQP